MAKFDDFNLGLKEVKTTSSDQDVQPRWQSKSFCTPGCKTGLLMGCSLKSITCHCHISR